MTANISFKRNRETYHFLNNKKKKKKKKKNVSENVLIY